MNWRPRDILNPEILSDEKKFHALLSWFRENDPCPVIETTKEFGPDAELLPFRLITRYNDIVEVEKHPAIFPNTLDAVLTPEYLKEESIRNFGRFPVLETLIAIDPPKHTAYRKVTQTWFNPGEIKKLETTIRVIASEQVDKMGLSKKCDFVTDVTTWYPLQIIVLILGLPRTDEPYLMKATQELLAPLDPDTLGERAGFDRHQQAMDFMNYFVKVTEDRRAHPTGDVASIIANATIDGEEMPLELKLSYLVLLIVAGHDTTKFASGGGMRALLEHPEQMKKLRERPELMPQAIEEMIRWTSPVRHFTRTAQEDYALSGTQIKKGEKLALLYTSGCRDTSVIKDADQFLIDREPNRHLAFGHGIHQCLGQHLARLEMRVLFEEILARFDNIQMDGPPEGLASLFVAGTKKLPIRYS